MPFCEVCQYHCRDFSKVPRTEHSPTCPQYDPMAEAIAHIKALTSVMQEWGSWEDGIPESFAPVYDAAAFFVGEKFTFVTDGEEEASL